MIPFPRIEEAATLHLVHFESSCTAYAACAYLEDHIAVCRIMTNYEIFVDTRNSEIVPYLIKDGFREMCLT